MTAEEATPIRVLIVDDEPLAREKIRALVGEDPGVEVVGECGNGAEAVEQVRALAPDLLLLDVQMPEAGGFDVLEALAADRPPLVIFITAYDRYAVRAFEVNAFDYLLKPFDRERFSAAIERAKEQIRRQRDGDLGRRILTLLEQIKDEPKHLERLVVKTGGRIFFIQADEIDWVEAEGNYVQIHVGKKAHLLRETLTNLEAQLDPKKFVRIHRSTIVNLSRVRELHSWTHGEYHVILHDGTQLTLSRNYRDNLQSVLGGDL